MKIYRSIRQQITPNTAAVIGWAGFSVVLILTVLIAAFNRGNTAKAGAVFTTGMIIAVLFVVFWFVFGRCYECGHVPRPGETFCSQCGAPLDKVPAKKDDAAEKSSVPVSVPEDARDLTETQVTSEEIFDGVVLHLFKDTVRLPDGNSSLREYVKHVGAVCIVPVTDDGKVIVERQYRYAVGQALIEIPAGKLDYAGEDRLSAAKRELREETGYTADRWTDMGLYLTAPAFSDEKISMYLAEGLHKGAQDLDEDEFLDVYEVPIKDLVEDILAGRITDAKTQAGILKAYSILNR